MAQFDPETPAPVWINVRDRVARVLSRNSIAPHETPSIYDLQYAEALLAAGYIDIAWVAVELASRVHLIGPRYPPERTDVSENKYPLSESAKDVVAAFLALMVFGAPAIASGLIIVLTIILSK